MVKRLEATLFGALFRVSVLRIDRALAREGIRTYGARDWNVMISDIALGSGRAKLLSEVRHTLGKGLTVERRIDGVLSGESAFGLELFHGGRPMDADGLAAENLTLRPETLLRDAAAGDIIGVFRGRCEGALSFRWDDADDALPRDISLTFERLDPLLNMREPFELLTDVVWKDAPGRRRLDKGRGFAPLKPVFHTAGFKKEKRNSTRG